MPAHRKLPSRARREHGDRGATLIEFALIVPLLLMLVFGLFSGGVAYNRNLAVSYAAQQTARYAATLDVDAFDSVDEWLEHVHGRVLATSEGELVAGTQDRRICVAFVDPAGGRTRSRTATTSDTSATLTNSPCFADGLPNSEVRSQVSLSRGDAIDLIVFGKVDLTLAKDVTTRYEVRT